MDTSKEVLAGVKRYLLSQPAIRELTKNGESILSILYDPAIAKATFLPS